MTFERAVEIVLAEEGGYINDPNDPGGETRYGISKRAYPELDIAKLTVEQAKAIYRRDYWEPCKCDKLPWPLSLYVFDCAVNQGVVPAIKLLQRAVQTTQDGVLGQQTLTLASRANPWHMAQFMAFRAMRYQSTRNFDRFGAGWLTRLFTVAAKGAANV